MMNPKSICPDLQSIADRKIVDMFTESTQRWRNVMGKSPVRIMGCLVAVASLAACSSSSSSSSSVAEPTSTSHMMGMSTGPDAVAADVDASPYVFGILPNGSMALDTGVERQVAVIAQGEATPDGAVPVVVRNMTRDTVHMVQAHVDLVDTNDQVVDSGSFVFLAPFVVAPGEIAFGAVPLGTEWDLASGKLRAKVDSFNVMAPGPQARTMAVVTEASIADGAVTGTATNATDTTLAGGVTVTAMCFDTIRRPFHVATVDVPGDLRGGDSAGFSIPLGDKAATCSQMLLTAAEIG